MARASGTSCTASIPSSRPCSRSALRRSPRPPRPRCDLNATSMPAGYAERRISAHVRRPSKYGRKGVIAAGFCEAMRGSESGRRVSNPRPSAWEPKTGVSCPYLRAIQVVRKGLICGRSDQEGCPGPLPGRAAARTVARSEAPSGATCKLLLDVPPLALSFASARPVRFGTASGHVTVSDPSARSSVGRAGWEWGMAAQARARSRRSAD